MTGATHATVRSGGAAPIRIEAVRAFLAEAPISKRKYVLLEIETDAGIVGIGDATFGDRALEVGAAITRLQPLLVGQDPIAGEALWHAMAAQNDAANADFWAALGGVDMALWDIRGKLLGVPVHMLTGGPTRLKARIFTPLSGRSIEDVIECAHLQYRQGVRVFQFSVAPPAALEAASHWAEDARRTLARLRKALPKGEFVVSGQGRLSAAKASVLAQEFQPLRPLWLDEPLPRRWKASLRSVARRTMVPLGAGRWDRSLGDFMNYMREGVLDVLRPDIISSGGITNLRKVGHLAEAHYAALAPFNDGTPVATAAALQVAASVSNFYIQEIPWPGDEEDRQMRTDLLAQPMEIFQDGYIALPSGPGLGVEVRQESLERFRVEGAE